MFQIVSCLIKLALEERLAPITLACRQCGGGSGLLELMHTDRKR
jgi:hypothetical protein